MLTLRPITELVIFTFSAISVPEPIITFSPKTQDLKQIVINSNRGCVIHLILILTLKAIHFVLYKFVHAYIHSYLPLVNYYQEQ